jgi:stage IV sporulation protein FB
MRDLLSWNLPLGRWGGVHVRLHFFFILFAVVALHLAHGAELSGYAAMSLAILLVSVLAHEFAHCFAAWKTGGHADQIILWPFGGLTHVNVTQDPQIEIVTALAGPMVNLAVCLVVLPAIIASQTGISALLNPLSPPVPLVQLTWPDGLRMTFWINWLLALVNLLPAYPMDGGRAMRAMLWQRWDYHRAAVAMVRIAIGTAVAMVVLAMLVQSRHEYAALPLVLFGLFLFFSARQEAERMREHESGDATLGYDFSQGYTSLERHESPRRERKPGPLRRWLEARRTARIERQQQQEVDEERRVDEILARLHETGMAGLSDEDRALLDRVSARYRDRQSR